MIVVAYAVCRSLSSVASAALQSTVAAFLSDLSSFLRGKFFKNVSVGVNGLLLRTNICVCGRIICDAVSYGNLVIAAMCDGQC